MVLNEAGEYEPWITGGGAVWLVGEDGALERPLLPLGEREGAGDLVWSPGGDELLATVVVQGEEFPVPEKWRLLRLPLVGAPEVLLEADYPLLTPTYLQTESVILYLAAPEERLELHRLEPDTGKDELLAADVLTYLTFGERVFTIGRAGELVGPAGEPVVGFDCPEEDCQMFLSLWPRLFMDLAPSGEFLALVIADRPGLTLPEVDPITSLCLVNLEEGEAARLATPALSPSFSPEGYELAFVAAPPGGTQRVYIYDVDSGETSPLPGSEGAVWVRWGRTGIIVAVEHEEGGYRLLRWDGAGWQELLVRAPE
ncbi:hypothetical protein LR090_07505 [Candidatus Bipolaricaulota bacterium]|nr:hypothetical protein [Candidatus Bipolaricaulota bacterium]